MFSQQHTQVSSGGYQISRSLRFNSADSAYLNRTPASAGNKQTWTLSVWVKRAGLSAFMPIYSAGPASPRAYILLNSSDKLDFRSVDSGNTEVIRLTTTQVFRDPSAWYHIVVAQDTTQATSSNRVRIYVNGTQITAFDTATYPTQNISNLAINDALEQNYGRYVNSPSDGYLSAYLTETNFIDGSQLTPSSFGETNAQTGVWQPKAYSGSYGTNGFYLNFSDNSNTTAATLGKDYSGNGNNWTPNNFSVTAGVGNDSLVDSPTSYGVDTGAGGSVRGNYCTFNPLFKLGGTTALTWALNGNLQAKSDSNASMVVYGTMGLDPSTKFYNEFTITNTVEGGDHVGIVTDIQAVADGGTCVAYRADGQKIVNGTVSSYGASYTDNDVIGIAVNLVDNQVTFYKNGTSQGTITGVTSGTYFHRVRFNNVAGQQTEVYGNWGQRAFAYTAPSGFKALCTQNLPTPTIGSTSTTLATKYFNPVLYTGNGSTLTVTGVGFQPDWVWLKARSSGGSSFTNNVVIDSVRGSGTYGYKNLYTNTTEAEYDPTSGNASVNSLNSDGFVLGGNSNTNYNTMTAVAWNWKANGSGSTNTSGSITSTVSANTTSGFSVVTYTGNGTQPSTVGHGLGVAPSFIIVKTRNSASYDWNCYHVSLGNTQYIALNTTAAASSAVSLWNNTTPTSTVFTINHVAVNTSSNTYVAYCFAPIAGYSAFGSYTGNGSSDGAFVYTGFRPRWILVKDTSSAQNWIMVDTARNTSNVANNLLVANLSDAEFTTTGNPFDIVSNGFKLRGTSQATNGSGDTYIFAAFAESPFKYSLAR